MPALHPLLANAIVCKLADCNGTVRPFNAGLNAAIVMRDHNAGNIRIIAAGIFKDTAEIPAASRAKAAILLRGVDEDCRGVGEGCHCFAFRNYLIR